MPKVETQKSSRITLGLLRPRLQEGTPWLLPQQVSWSREIHSYFGRQGETPNSHDKRHGWRKERRMGALNTIVYHNGVKDICSELKLNKNFPLYNLSFSEIQNVWLSFQSCRQHSSWHRCPWELTRLKVSSGKNRKEKKSHREKTQGNWCFRGKLPKSFVWKLLGIGE